MKKLLFVCLVSILSGCVFGPNSVMDAKRSLDNRFTYLADRGDQWSEMATSGPVTGDCEDYAITLQKEVGGTMWIAYPLTGGDAHAFLCHGVHCVDNGQLPFKLDPTKYRSVKQIHPYEIWKRTTLQREISE